MKALILLALVATTCSGCLTSKLDKTIAALAKDNASARVRVTSLYGVIEYTRSNPGVNTPPHSVSPDGTINVAEATKPEVIERVRTVTVPATAPAPPPAPSVQPSTPRARKTAAVTPIPRVPAPKATAKTAPKAAATNTPAKKPLRPIPKSKQVPSPPK